MINTIMINTHIINMKYIIACQIYIGIKHGQKKNEKMYYCYFDVIIIGSSNNSSINISMGTSTSNRLYYWRFKTILSYGEFRTETMSMCMEKIWLKNMTEMYKHF